MAFVILRRSRNTRSYYLVESYRERGRVKKRTVCYLGREKDKTDTLEKATRHWERVLDEVREQIQQTRRGTQRLESLRRKRDRIRDRLRVLKRYRKEEARTEEGERWRQEILNEYRLRPHWKALYEFRDSPSRATAAAAKQAFRILAKEYHPDTGTNPRQFIRMKNLYDDAKASFAA